MFVVLEGIDGSGKTTVSNILISKLKKDDYRCIKINFPNRRTFCGNLIDQVLKGKTNVSPSHLATLFSLNRWQSQMFIKEKLAKGFIVICDRYTLSALCYGDEFQYNTIKNLDKGLIKPDVIVYLDACPKIAQERTSKRKGEKEIYDSVKKQEIIYQKYKKEIESKTHGKIEIIKNSHLMSCEKIANIILNKVIFDF